MQQAKSFSLLFGAPNFLPTTERGKQGGLRAIAPRWVLFVLSCALSTVCAAADNERTVGFKPSTVAVVGATLVPSPGEQIENGTLVISNGLIADVGINVEPPAGAEVIDGEGLFVYAGFIDGGNAELLDEEKKPTPPEGRKVDFSRYALAATRPDNRRGLTPEFRALEACVLDDEKLDAARKLGFTAIHALPTGRIASGQGVLVATSALPLRESVLDESTFSQFRLFAPRDKEYPATLMGATAHLRQAFLDADRFALHRALYGRGVKNIERPPFDLAWSALEQVRAGQTRALFHVETRDDIHRALNFAAEQNIAPALWGADEAYRVIERLDEEQIELIMQLDFGDEPKVEPNDATETLTADVNEPLRVQRDKRDRWHKRVGGLAELYRREIPFAVSSHELKDRGELFGSLRKAIEFGLPREAALAALTSNAAAILGIDNRLGTLVPGKLGHAVVMTGPFEHKDSKVRYAFVDGHKFEYESDAEPAESVSSGEEADVDLDGSWSLRIESAEGSVLCSLVLSQEKSRLTGRFRSEQGDGRLTSGRIKDQTVEFTVAIGAGDREVQLKFTGMLSEGKLSGELKPAFGAVTTWSAERTRTEMPDDEAVAAQLAESGENKLDEPEDIAPNSPIDLLPTELESDRRTRPIQTGGNVLIENATVLTGTQQTLPGASVLVRDGKIAAVGNDIQAEQGVTVIDASGRYLMPGIIDTHSHIMVTAGINEATQSIVPEVRIRDVINSDDPREYRALAGGVTAIRVLHGSANVVGGQDAVVKLKYGRPAHEQILYDVPQGVKFALGENVKYRESRFPNTRLGVEATLNRAFMEAVDYRRSWQGYERKRAARNVDRSGQADELLPPRRDLRLEALADIVNHKKFIHSHCYRADEILMLLRVTSNLGIRVWSLQHVLEGYKVAPEIVAHGASCSTFADWWAYKVEAYDATAYNAALLNEAGANVVIKSDNSELMRHLYLEAAKPIRYGNMHPDDVLQTITLNAARELGLDDRMGSVEAGKDADLAIFSGHPLNAFSRCEMTLIDGEVYFAREHAVSAMLPEAADHSAGPHELLLPPPEVRAAQLDLAESPNRRYAIQGATLHPVDAAEIADGVLLIEDGRIAALGEALPIPSDTKIIDAAGLHVWPGLIDAGTTLGLVEIGRVRETHDFSEGGQFQPDIRAGVALNPDSELLPVARAGGITTVLVRPTGGVVAGQASIVKLSGWTAPEMVMQMEAGLQVNWPAASSEKERKEAEQHIEQLKNLLQEARLYSSLLEKAESEGSQPPISDPRLEALRPYVSGEKTVFIEANSRRQIAEALLFAEKEKLDVVITGGAEAWKLADELKKRDVPLIIGPVMRSPLEAYDPYDAPYANAGRLHAAGVRFCFRSDNAANSRNTPFEAAQAVAYGLPVDEAVRGVTLASAEILGIADDVGSLTPGKLANLVVTDGSPLQQTTQVYGIFVTGSPFAPESRQTRYYERYRSRLRTITRREAEPAIEAGSR